MSVVENLNIERVAKLEAQVESIKEDVTEMKRDIKSLDKKFDESNLKMVQHLDASIDKLAVADKEQHENLRKSMENVKGRVDVLERWRWMIAGGAIVLGYIAGHSDFISNILK